MLIVEYVDQLLIHAVSGAQVKFALRLVVHVDRAGVGAGERHCLCDNGREHGLKIQRRIHSLRYFAERAKLPD